ncbi:MAG TPA: hypothetical protein DDX91_06105 [Ruminococcaceae bacterium]|nr:hypothetical protein [Oscillospiraceae bacterium]
MVEIKTLWTEENLKEYTKYTTFVKGRLNKVMFIALLVLYAAVVGGCIALFCMFKFTFALVMAIAFTVLLAVCILFFALTVKDFVKTALKAGENEEFDSVLINEDNIFICKNGQPIGELEWDKITRIYTNEKAGAVYLCTAENAVLILEYKNIVGGTEKELKDTVEKRYDKLSKKA